MELYFLRHGDAEVGGERPLSDRGREEMEAVAARLKRLELGLDVIYTSPLLRAKQTAEIVGQALRVQVVVSDLLDSGARLEDIIELLMPHGRGDSVMLVGHEPDFSAVIGDLIGSGAVEMKKAGLARITCEKVGAAAGVLKWLAPPRLLVG
jgi:phosphohistidine phosphatase